MKSILTSFLLIIFFNVQSFSQNTRLNFFVGGEATQLDENENAYLHVTPIYDNIFFQELSFLFGVELEQSLLYDFDLILRTSVGKKYVTNTYSGGNIPILSYELLHLYNTITIRKNINKRLKIYQGSEHPHTAQNPIKYNF